VPILDSGLAGFYPGQQLRGGCLSWAVAWRVSSILAVAWLVLILGRSAAAVYPGQERGGCLSWEVARRVSALGRSVARAYPGQ